VSVHRLRRMAAVLAAGLALTAGGCGDAGSAGAEPPTWRDGRLYIATGNTTGVFYVLGGGFADIITRHLPRYEARAEPTSASVENIKRLDLGDMELALTNGDSAADGVAGSGAFGGKPQRIAALARLYSNYTHVVVRTSAKIKTFDELRGKRVSTGSPNSGTELLANRMLAVRGINPDTDITRQKLSLAETTAGMKAGSVDAMIFTGGLPTPGIADLMASAPGQFAMLPLNELVEPMNLKYGKVYTVGKLAKNVYGTPTDVATLNLPILLIAAADMPEQLAYDLTKLLFDRQEELGKAHPEGKNFDRTVGEQTGVVPLHRGAKRYYVEQA